MTPADDGGWRDELAPEPMSAHVVPVAVVAVVVLAALVTLAVATRPAHRHAASAPRPVPSVPTSPVPSASSSAPDLGSVLSNGIPACIHTDHRARIDVAMSFTNLTNVPLQIVSAAAAAAGLQVTALHVGSGRCGETSSTEAARLRPGHEVVVALRFAVGPTCPVYGEVAATLTINAAGRAVHAATPSLADLRTLGFPGC